MEKICEYCSQAITDKNYVYKYFVEKNLHLPVHKEHLEWSKNMQKGKPYNKEGNK